LLWLVVVALAMSAVSLYYYLMVLKQIYVAEPQAGTEPPRPVLIQVVLALVALAVVVLGCVPDLIINKLNTAIQLAGF
jgi:NADH-quinone oxidoreductase subunit N